MAGLIDFLGNSYLLAVILEESNTAMEVTALGLLGGVLYSANRIVFWWIKRSAELQDKGLQDYREEMKEARESWSLWLERQDKQYKEALQEVCSEFRQANEKICERIGTLAAEVSGVKEELQFLKDRQE